MRLLNATALVIFCTIFFLFGSRLSPILLSKINIQELLRVNATNDCRSNDSGIRGISACRGASDSVRSDRK
jgi:hypothetical protein